MQVKQEVANKDWHQRLLADLLKSPLVQTRVGSAFTRIGELLKFDLTKEFPATKAKKLHFDMVARELFCFLKGYTSKADLNKHGVTIWDADMKRANRNNIGPIYGKQWRQWGASSIDEIRLATHNGFDQLRWAIDELKKTGGTSRRALVSAWNAPEVLSPAAVLPPCHVLFQFNIVGNTLYTDVYQRSADVFLGLPFDVAQFAIISRLVANELSWCAELNVIQYEVLNYHLANYHLYEAHKNAALQELNNEPTKCSPFLICSDSVDSFDYRTCELHNYSETRFIKAKLLT